MLYVRFMFPDLNFFLFKTNGTRSDTELLILHAILVCNALNREKKNKKQCILWFITY